MAHTVLMPMHIIGAGSWLTIVFLRIELVLDKRSKESKARCQQTMLGSGFCF